MRISYASFEFNFPALFTGTAMFRLRPGNRKCLTPNDTPDGASTGFKGDTMISAKIVSRLLLMAVWLLLVACSSRDVALINPKNGATAKCSAMGAGIGAAWVQSYIGKCIREYESTGYVKMDELTAEQRADLERRGLLLRE
jgi:hypothetical protein